MAKPRTTVKELLESWLKNQAGHYYPYNDSEYFRKMIQERHIRRQKLSKQ